MTREQQIQTEALLILRSGQTEDPDFYASKRRLRKKARGAGVVEILPNKITVIDHNMTVHRF